MSLKLSLLYALSLRFSVREHPVGVKRTKCCSNDLQAVVDGYCKFRIQLNLSID